MRSGVVIGYTAIMNDLKLTDIIGALVALVIGGIGLVLMVDVVTKTAPGEFLTGLFMLVAGIGVGAGTSWLGRNLPS